MSSYVVADRTINRVLGFMYFDSSRGTVISDLRKLGINAETEPERLGRKMIALNCRATGERYSKKVAAAYTYKLETASKVQAIKSLSCWLYQCSEGNIAERSKLWRVLRAYRDDLALDIVKSLPEYDQAEWG